MTIKSAAAMMLNALFILCLFLAVSSTQSSAQSTPSYQSVSGEFAQKWIKDFKGDQSEADRSEVDQSEVDQSEVDESEVDESEGNQSKE
ncbi:MAG: hypothetical protein LUO89_16460, partial [Methanothrix sp.]|nr:hypothetical protein [Methanothrix sp.]